MRDRLPAQPHDLADQFAAGRCQADPGGTPIIGPFLPLGQPFADQPVAHPRRRGRGHIEFLRKINDPLRAARDQDDQHSVLRQSHVLVELRQRPRRKPHQYPAESEQGVGDIGLDGVQRQRRR
jgi:hypothetical protein